MSATATISTAAGTAALPPEDAWRELGWPSTRLEAWRYFPLKVLEATNLAHTLGVPDAASLPPLGEDDHTIVVLNGRFAPGLGHAGPFGPWISVGRASGPSHAPGGWDSGLEAANAAFGSDTLQINVPAGLSADKPLRVRVYALGDGVLHPRIEISLGDRSRCDVIIEHGGEGAQIANIVTVLQLGYNSTLHLVTIVRQDPRTTHIDTQTVTLAAGATFRSFTATLRGLRARTATSVHLAGTGADARCDGLYLPVGEDRFDHYIDFAHEAARTVSHATWAAAIDDRAIGTFQGRVRIGSEIRGCSTRQLTRSLLLSPTATANAKPELHIDCDEVEASHGATIGQLDARQLYYLMSRGIAPETARTMLIEAFVRDAVGRAPETARATVAKAVSAVIGASSSEDTDAE